MKLRKDQRYTAYCIMLAETEDMSEYEEGGTLEDGFCWMICKLFGLHDKDFIKTEEAFSFAKVIIGFPELKSKKPKNRFDQEFWFPKASWDKTRTPILKQCIKETENF